MYQNVLLWCRGGGEANNNVLIYPCSIKQCFTQMLIIDFIHFVIKRKENKGVNNMKKLGDKTIEQVHTINCNSNKNKTTINFLLSHHASVNVQCESVYTLADGSSGSKHGENAFIKEFAKQNKAKQKYISRAEFYAFS